MDACRRELTSSSVATPITDGYIHIISQDEELTFRSSKERLNESDKEETGWAQGHLRQVISRPVAETRPKSLKMSQCNGTVVARDDTHTLGTSEA